MRCVTVVWNLRCQLFVMWWSPIARICYVMLLLSDCRLLCEIPTLSSCHAMLVCLWYASGHEMRDRRVKFTMSPSCYVMGPNCENFLCYVIVMWLSLAVWNSDLISCNMMLAWWAKFPTLPLVMRCVTDVWIFDVIFLLQDDGFSVGNNHVITLLSHITTVHILWRYLPCDACLMCEFQMLSSCYAMHAWYPEIAVWCSSGRPLAKAFTLWELPLAKGNIMHVICLERNR